MSTILEALKELNTQDKSTVGNRLRTSLVEMKINEKTPIEKIIKKYFKESNEKLIELLNKIKDSLPRFFNQAVKAYFIGEENLAFIVERKNRKYPLLYVAIDDDYVEDFDSLKDFTEFVLNDDDFENFESAAFSKMKNIILKVIPNYEKYLKQEQKEWEELNLDESLNEDIGDDFYGYKEGTEEADDVLFALQVQYGHPEYNYDDFRKLNLKKEEVEKAIKYVDEKGYNKFTYFDESLNEDVASSMPVTILPHDDVYNYIENVPQATQDRPPYFFSVGYIRELGSDISSKFRGGRGSDGNAKVRIFKCSEMTVYTGANYEKLKATKKYRKETGKERSGERTGFSFEGENTILDKIGLSSTGQEQLQCYMKKGTKPKVKYFISLDDEDLRAASKEEVANYLTPAKVAKLLGNTPEPEEIQPVEGADIMRLKLSQIYKIGNLGRSVIR